MKALLTLLFFTFPLFAGSLQVHIQHSFGKTPLQLGSLKYQAAQQLSVTRLSYLLSGLALQKNDNTWLELPAQFAWIDLSPRRNTFTLRNIPSGSYRSIRFHLGVPKKTNHLDPTQFPADHPLNPNLNNLHWNQEGGYIFMSLEGLYRNKDKELKGYVYHLANDANLSLIQLSAPIQLKTTTALALSLDLQKLLTHPRPLSFEKDGHSTHSHPGDPIPSALLANLQSAFTVLGTSYPPHEIPSTITPLYLPKKHSSFPFKMSQRFPIPTLPLDNPLLNERVALGESLFHDKSLSKDGTISCASCHQSKLAFTDGLPLAKGIDDQLSDKNSMPLFNLAWKSSFFWDGRAKSLREQVLQPITDHREMAAHLPTVIAHLQKTRAPDFEKAFGPGPVTSEKLALALENFLLTLTSYNSKFDLAMSGKSELTDQEKRGMELFFTEYEPRSKRYGADCFHCHGGANFSDHQLHDNGLGGKFTTPSLRNLTLTAPYMHDGRFESLEQVIAHYNGPMTPSETLDPNLAKHPKLGLQLSKKDQNALVAFLKTLTDPKYPKSAR